MGPLAGVALGDDAIKKGNIMTDLSNRKPNDFDDTRIEFGDMDQTLLDSQSGVTISITVLEDEVVPTIEIQCLMPDIETPDVEMPPLDEMIAQTFLELNKLPLPPGDEIRIRVEDAPVPFGVTCLIMAHLLKIYGTIKVYSKETATYEPVSL